MQSLKQWTITIGVGLAVAIVGFLGLMQYQRYVTNEQNLNALLNVVGYNLQLGVLRPLPQAAAAVPAPAAGAPAASPKPEEKKEPPKSVPK